MALEIEMEVMDNGNYPASVMLNTPDMEEALEIEIKDIPEFITRLHEIYHAHVGKLT